jgi:hypothetical protein
VHPKGPPAGRRAEQVKDAHYSATNIVVTLISISSNVVVVVDHYALT